MEYSELTESEARDSEVQTFLVDGDAVPMTFRIPGNFRGDSAKEATALRGMSLSAFVRMCMIQELSKRG